MRPLDGVCALLSLSIPTVLAAQLPPGERYGYLLTRGGDTVALERVTRGPAGLQDEILVPGRARLVVSVVADGRGCVREGSVTVYAWGSAPGASPLQRLTLRLDGDSVRGEMGARDVSRTFTLPSAGSRFLLFGQSVAASALMADCARTTGADTASLVVLPYPGLRPDTVRFRRFGRDSLYVLGTDTSRVWWHADGQPARVLIGGSATLATRLEAGAMDRVAFAAPDYAAPTGAPYRAEPVTVPAESGVTLAGTLTIPSGTGRVPAVITISGSGADDRDESAPVAGGYRPFRDLADTLARRGIAVLRFDDRGVGQSGGDFGTATERTFAADVGRALAYMRTRPDIEPERLAVVGHSEGARVAMLVASEDARLAGVVLMAGAAQPRLAMVAQLERVIAADTALAARHDSIVRAYERRLDSMALTMRREVLRWDPGALARRIRAPVLVLQGATDTQVPPSQADSLAAVLRRSGVRDVTVRAFPEVNHLFLRDADGDFTRYDRLTDGRVAPEVRGVLADWLVERFGRR